MTPFIFSRFFDRRPLVNCDLPGQLLEGRLILKPNLKAFKDTGVVFEDGTVEDQIDAVVFCTGYHGSFPFLPPTLFEGPRRELLLYKLVFGVLCCLGCKPAPGFVIMEYFLKYTKDGN